MLVVVSLVGGLGISSATTADGYGAVPAAPVAYSVTFDETGLASGTNWSVTFNGSSSASTGTSISFSAPDGTYNFTVPHLVGRYPSPANGAITVSGGPVTQPINWSSSPEYNVTITETGLPVGTEWVSVLAGTHHVSFTNVAIVPQGTGTYNWSVVSIPSPGADGTAGWASTVFAGTLKVSSGPAWINVTFVRGWAVTISQSGLPSQTTWKLGLNGTIRSSVNAQVVYILPNASYTFHILSPLPGPIGVRYVPNVLTLLENVVGANLTAAVSYATQYFLTVSASPTAGGSVTPASEWVNASSVVGLSATPAAEYRFSGWSGLGVGNYTGSSPTPTITVGGPIQETAVFDGFFAVNFTETGLPAGTTWDVTLNGVFESSSSSTINFTETNGVYLYSIDPIVGYILPSYSGHVTVNGADITVPVPWSPVTFALTFTESGLPTGTSWSVTIGSSQLSSTGTTIVFAEPNGTWAYTVGLVSGYSTPQRSGDAVINGGPTNVAVPFTVVTYKVSFVATGLPSGQTWSVTLAGTINSSATSTITFAEPNGTWSFSVGTLSGRLASPASGTVPVSGAPVVQGITWSGPFYAVAFIESGLPQGTSWSVTVQSSQKATTSTSNSFNLTNGTFTYTVGSVAGYSATPSSGSVTVNGLPVTVTIVFSAFTFSVTFTETGLGSGTNWTVTLNGVAHSSTSTTISFAEANGSYNFQVGNLSGYTSSPSSGSITVSDKNVDQAVAFQGTSSSSNNGTTNLLLYVVLPIVIVLAAILTILALRRRRRQTPEQK